MLHRDNIISSDLLYLKLEKVIPDSKFAKAARLLLEAISDWPTSITEPKELILVLSIEIRKPLTLDNITSYCENLKPTDSAWKMEAISSVMKIFDYNKTQTFDAIVWDISEHYKSIES